MKKTMAFMLMVVLLVCAIVPICVSATDGGPAQVDGVYQIKTAADLAWFGNYVNKTDDRANAVLCNDIDISSTFDNATNIIGIYKGIFDGQGHTISGLNLSSRTNGDHVGLFKELNDSAVVKNFTLKGSITDGDTTPTYLGAVAARAKGDSTVSNITVIVNITESGSASNKHFGGIIGSTNDLSKSLTLRNCFYSGTMTVNNASDCVGGVIGYANEKVTIQNCGSIGTITNNSSTANVGGILGYVNNSGFQELSGCYSDMTLPTASGNDQVGGIIGYLKSAGGTINKNVCKTGVTPYGKYTGNTFTAHQVSNWQTDVRTYLSDVWTQNLGMNGGRPIFKSSLPDYDLVLTPASGLPNYNYENGVLTLLGGGEYTLTMKSGKITTTSPLVINNSESEDVTLNISNVNINCSEGYVPAIRIVSSAKNVTLNLIGTNTLAGGSDCAGLQKENTADLTIGGTGSLAATGGANAAGINSIGGTVTIGSGTVTATGGTGGAGIGGSFSTGANGSAFITASSISDQSYKTNEATSGILIEDGNGTVYGNQTLTENFELASGKTLTIPEGSILTIPEKVTLTNNGRINKYGTLINNGTLDGSGVVVEPVAYLDENGETQECKIYTELTAAHLTSNNYKLSSGWYAVKGEVSATQRITVNGEVHIILTDGSTLDAESGGIHVAKDNSLTIYAQSTGEDMGALIAASTEEPDAGIGGKHNESVGTITINGGTVNATSSSEGAGIGGGSYGKSGTGTINSGTITINGGTVTANGERGAGIGGGACGDDGTITINCGTITINGGTVTANSSDGGAGIGGGYNESVGTITINGGTVTANSRDEAGIGDGGGGVGGTITISGGTVTANSSDGSAGIGGRAVGTIIISGGIVTANSSDSRAGIGGRDDGAFSTGENGSAVIIASSISDQSYKEREATSGIIFDNGNGFVGGNQTLPKDFTLESGKILIITEDSTLTIAEDVTLTNNGVIVKFGGLIGDKIFGSGIVISDFAEVKTKRSASYLDENGNEQQFPDCTELTAAYLTVYNCILENGWYVVNGVVNAPGRITVNGDANIILADDSLLDAQSGGIHVAGDNSLTVYAQSTGEKMGRLIAVSTNNNVAGIGGGYRGAGGTITINGGNVTATGGYYAAGIGGGGGGDGGTITINGGNVTATGEYSAGIGGGGGGDGGTITINGGTITANSSEGGAGIGGGGGGAGDTIIINGGTVNATSSSEGAGIGGGGDGAGGTITINGGTVTAMGGTSEYGSGAGIGDGLRGDGGKFSTGENGSAVIIASSISDQSYKESEATSGIIFDNGNGFVGGNQTLTKNSTLESGKVLIIANGSALTIAENVTLTNNGVIVKFGALTGDEKIVGGGSIISDSAAVVTTLSASYLDKNGDEQQPQDCTELTVDYLAVNNYILEKGWYVVNEDVTAAQRITVNGGVHIILADGSLLNAQNGGIHVAGGNSLTVYAQSTGEDMGRLIAVSTNYNDAGIGGGAYGDGGTITINGGNVTAMGGTSEYGSGAGIGGGYSGAGGTITINGGNVTANGSENGSGAGIGGGAGGDGGTIIINGGNVTASGEYGAGIGGGDVSGDSEIINGGTITINGGTITANSSGGGAGIGGGYSGAGGTITINGGNVTASGEYGAGIGDGLRGDGGKFSTGENGSAFIVASSISDQSNKANWQGVIIEGDSGTVYGDQTLTADFTLASGKTLIVPEDTTLTIASGVTLTVANGATLTNDGTVNVEGTLVLPSNTVANMALFNGFTGSGVIQMGDKTCSTAGEVKDEKFAYISASLGEDISLTYYIKKDTFAEAPRMRFTINGHTAIVHGETDGDQYAYKFTGIAPQWMGDTITAELLDANDAVIATKVYSVSQYLNKLMDMTAEELKLSAEKLTALQTLINDLLVYGGAAQVFTGHKPSTLVSDGVTGSDFAAIAANDRSLNNNGTFVTFTGATVNFNNINSLKLRFTAEDTAGLVIKYRIGDGEEKVIEYVSDGAGSYLITTPGIKASHYTDVYTFTAYKDGKAGATLTYSVTAYVYAMKDSENWAMAMLAKATYNYGVSAKAFADMTSAKESEGS